MSRSEPLPGRTARSCAAALVALLLALSGSFRAAASEQEPDGAGSRNASSGGARGSATAAPAASSPLLVARDVLYLEGGDPVFHSLDVYAPPGARDLPVLVYIHGGALFRGDKRHVAEKPEFFCGRGWVLVSINYRLSPAVKHPAHVEDAAAAVAWVARNVERYGGDPKRIALVAHSAGALLGALLATDERRLEAHGLGLDALSAVVLLEGQEFDVESRMRWAQTAMPDRLADPYSKFGDTAAEWRDLSVIRHVEPDEPIPPILLVACGIQFQFYEPGQESKAFLAALWRAGATAEYYFAADKDHGGVNQDLTSDDDMSRTATSFLARHVGAEE